MMAPASPAPRRTMAPVSPALKQRRRWARIPMVALSSHATEGDVVRGRQVGFNDYVAKFDRDNLVATLAQPALWADE